MDTPNAHIAGSRKLKPVGARPLKVASNTRTALGYQAPPRTMAKCAAERLWMPPCHRTCGVPRSSTPHVGWRLIVASTSERPSDAASRWR
eukprot:990028-Prymnesium_polylepis.1